MRVRIRLFAVLRELAGSEWIELELNDGATVADAMRQLHDQAHLGDVLERMPLQMAVNRDYATPQTALAAEDELALIPPLSGGEGSREDVHVRVTAEPLSLQDLSSRVACPEAGAIVVFQGVTRQVNRLDYEAYTEMAQRRMRSIADECLRSQALLAVAVEHRVGSVPLGQPSVIVAVAAAHRSEAFAGAREVIDRVKAEVPIWKREIDADGSGRWVQGAPAPGAAEHSQAKEPKP